MTRAETKQKFRRIILAYPAALILVAVVANLLFGIAPAVVASPSRGVLQALAVSAILLLANHTWLMTSTELTRLQHDMHATPEEWEASDHGRADVSEEGQHELERRHNAHRNATENTVQFVLLALLVSMVSAVTLAAQVWILGFAIGRLGHTWSYLAGRDGLRGLWMSVSLTSLYGLASYLALGLVV